MSRTVDEQVVRMEFDNRQFEQNVKTSMSTLDKLKQALKLDGASRGLEEVDKASRKIDFSQCEFAATRAGFHIQDVFEKTTRFLENDIAGRIKNAIVNTFNTLAVEPITTGFNEYELKIDSVRTILNSTGEPLEKVNGLLEELNKYSDETIYSFQDMTSNIGKFTNAGVKLEDAVLAIKGVSNEAAVSGANANEASRAMYNFAQALSAGYVKLIDWKSIENANMATVEFKSQLLETAVAMGTLERAEDGMYRTLEKGTLVSATQNFNDTLQEQWMTTNVLTQSLSNYAHDVTKMTDVEKAEYETKLRSIGYTEEQIEAIEKLGTKAFKSAQEVTKFTQMWDVLKETAQSGWAKTWELILGDIDQAKAIFTPLTNFFSGIIDSISDFRNRIVEGVLGSPITQFVNKISNFTESTVNAVDAVEDLGDVVQRVIMGEFGNGQERWDALTEAGYNWAKVQNAVNEALGDEFRHVVETTDAQKDQVGTIKNLTDAELKEKGLTEEEIKLYRKLEEQSKQTGKSIQELLDEDNKSLTGRELLIKSFENTGKGLVNIFKAIGKAWSEMLGTSDETKINAIYGILQKLYDITSSFSDKLQEDGETVDKLRRTFRGIFAILDMIRTVVGGGLNIAFRIFKAVLSAFNVDILDLTANIGDAVVAFRDWIKEHDIISKLINTIVPMIVDAAKAVYNWATTNEFLVNTYEKLKDKFTSVLDGLKNWIDGVKDAEDIPKYLIQGISNGLKDESNSLVKSAIEIGKVIIETIKNFLGIHSPSTEGISIGEYLIQGIIIGIQNGIKRLKEAATKAAETIPESFKNIDWSKVYAATMSFGIVLFVKKIADIIQTIVSPLEKINNILDGVSNVLSNVSNAISEVGEALAGAFSGVKHYLNAKALREVALSLFILVGAIALLTLLDPERLESAVVTVLFLMGALIGVMAALSQLMKFTQVANNESEGLNRLLPKLNTNLIGLGIMLLSLSVALLIMVGIVALIGKMDVDEARNGFFGLIALMGILMLFLVAIGETIKGKTAKNIGKLGIFLLELSVVLLIMVGVFKLAGTLSGEELGKGLAIMVLLGLFILALNAMGMMPGKGIKKIGGTLIAITIAMMLMIGVFKLAGTLSGEDFSKGTIVILEFLIFVSVLALIGMIPGDGIKKIGGTLIAISIAMLLMVGVFKLVTMLPEGAMIKGIGFMVVFLIFTGLLLAISNIAPSNILKVGVSMLAFAVAVAILAGVTIMLSLISLPGLFKGVIAVGLLGLIMAGMIAATKNAKDVWKSILALSIAIAVMAGVVAILAMMDPNALATPLLVMTVLMGMFALMAKEASGLSEDSFKPLIAMIAVIITIGIVIYLMTKLPMKEAIISAAALALVLLGISGALFVLSKIEVTNKTLVALGLMMLAILAIGFVLRIISDIPTSQATVGIAIIAAAILALSASMFLLSKANISMKTVAALGIMMLSIIVIAEIMVMLSSFNYDQLGQIAIGLLLVVGVIAAIALAVMLVKNGAAGAVGLAILLVALMAFIPVFRDLCNLDMERVSVGLIALAGALAILVIAGYAMAPIAPVLMTIAASFVLFGLGAMATATGLMLLATAIGMFMSLLQNGLTLLPIVISLILTLIPMIGLKLAETFLMIIAKLTEGIPIIVNLITTFITTMINAAKDIIPKLMDLVGYLIASLLETIAKYTPSIVDSGMKILLALLTGIKEHIYDVGAVVVDIYVEILRVIREKLPELAQAGVDTILTLIDALGQGIEDNAGRLKETIISFGKHILNAFKEFFGIHSPSTTMMETAEYLVLGVIKGIKNKMDDAKNIVIDLAKKCLDAFKEKYDDFKNAGSNIMNGIKDGINSVKDKVTESVNNVASNVVSGFKNLLGIHSPSRVFAEIGQYLDLGLVKGINKYANRVYSATEELGSGILTNVRDAVNDMNNYAINDIGLSPHVTPVMNLSTLQGTRLELNAGLNTIFNKPVDSLAMRMQTVQDTIEGSNSDVVSAVSGLRNDLNTLYNQDDQEIALYVDSRKLATSLAKPMNRQLNILSKRGAY